MDLYNWKLKLSEAKFFNSWTEKKDYLKICLNKATQNYEANKNKIEPYAVKKIQIGSKETGFKTINFDNPPRPQITHKKAFENDYNEFIKEIKKEVNKLDDYVDIENEINKCEQKKTIQQKFFCYTKLYQSYKKHLQNCELTFKKSNLKLYDEYANLYTPFITQIENRLNDLKNKPKPPINKAKKIVPLDPVISLQYIEKIITELNSFLFDNSTSDQWSNLFNEVPLKNPIILNVKATYKDVRYFFDELVSLEIISKEYNTKIVNLKAIMHNGKLLQGRTLKDAKQDMKKSYATKFQKKIDTALDKIK